ncbi:MAG: hypothetical protein H6700_08130 [Myxococcales bacterium]|nr:hypothetical protein [Myxococcales bacterium]MCB9531720.1 hypothetical protein [Myxococcales bacterium]
MSQPKFDLAEVKEIAKFLNIGGVLSVVVIALVVGIVWGSGCGPVIHSQSYAHTDPLGRPEIQDHPEAAHAEQTAAPAEHGH